MLPFTLLDVFADEALAGNALAVVHDADELSDEFMLRMARETRLAETTFLQTPADARADYRNRIWTVAEEVPFAGHPSLGSAVAVALARGDSDVTYVQETQAGLQPVTVTRDGGRAWASVVLEPAEFGAELDPERVMAAVGLTAADAHPELPPRLVTAGLAALLAPLAEPEALERIRADRAAVRALHPGSFNLYLAWYDESCGRARARSIPSRPAEAEDPATGSSAGPLLAYLNAARGIDRLEISQGVEIGRPSRLVAELEGGRARVGGNVIVVGRGELSLP